MRFTLLALAATLTVLASPAMAQSSAAFTTCLTGQVLCNKACGKGPTAMACINNCGSKAQACVRNNGKWDADSDDADESPPARKPSARRPSRSSEPDEDSESSSDRSSSRKTARSSKSGCTAEADFVHSWPVDKANDEFKFKFRVSSDDCGEYSCNGYLHYRVHFNWRSGGNSAKTTLISYRIPRNQRSVEVTDKTFPGPVGIPLDVRDVEIKEVSCTSP